MYTVKEKILCVEPLCFEKTHLEFNRHLIASLSEVYEIVFLGDTQYFNDLEMKNVQKFTINFKQGSLFENLRRYKFIFKYISNSEIKKFLFLSADNTLFPLFCLRYQKFFRYNKTVVVHHNNLFRLGKSKVKTYFYNKMLNNCNVGLTYLNVGAYNKAKQLFKVENINFYPHFLYPYEEAKNKRITPKIFLFIGRQATEAISSGFLEIFCKSIGKINTETKVIVASESEFNFLSSIKEYTTIKHIKNKLNKETYLNLIRKATYVVFPPNEDIEYRSSGVLIDSISVSTPFLSPQKGHFLEYEDVGFFYNKENLRDKIHMLISISDEDYSFIIEKIRKKKKIKINQHQQII